jgi:hypothetical protein
MSKIALLLLASLPFISGCKEDDGIEGLVKFVEGQKLGENTAYWFELLNSFGDWEKTLLVFGYWDNQQACNDLIGQAVSNAPVREYRCSPAN